MMLPPYERIPIKDHPELLIDEWVLREFCQKGYRIGFIDSEDYPQLYDGVRRLARLHIAVRSLAVDKGLRKPIGSPFDVHHVNENKCDARLRNLVAFTPVQHRRWHNQKKLRRKSKRRAKADLGFYRPHAPAECNPIPEMVGLTIERTAPREDSQDQIARRNLIRYLDALPPALAQRIGHLDSTTRIERTSSANWKSPETRKLGLTKPRLILREHELALVGLLVENGHDLSKTMRFVAQYSGVESALVERYVTRWAKSVAIQHAMEDWIKHRRLPRELSARWSPQLPVLSSAVSRQAQ